MRGLICMRNGSVVLKKDVPEPIVKNEEVLLRVRLAGICDTDLQLARGYMGYQGVLGHEFVAETIDGKRRVTAEINNACRTCRTCRAGRSNHCPNRTVLGILNHDGAMADFVSVPSVNLHDIPDEIDDRSAVFIEPLAAAFRILEQVEVDSKTSVAVVGDGKLGTLCARVLQTKTAGVHLVGKHAEKLKTAGKNIKTHLLDQIGSMEHTFDLVVDATGSSSGLETALRLVRPLGTVVLKTTVAGNHEVSLAPIVIDEVRVIGSRCGPFPRAIQALQSREIDVLDLIEAEYSLDDAELAFERAGRKGARKVLLRIDGN